MRPRSSSPPKGKGADAHSGRRPDSPLARQRASENLREKRDFDPIIKHAGQEYGVDPYLIKAVIQADSLGNPGAISSAGAQGLMQLMPKTAADLGVYDSFDPAQNIMGGTRYLRQLLDRYRGDRQVSPCGIQLGNGKRRKPPAVHAERDPQLHRQSGKLLPRLFNDLILTAEDRAGAPQRILKIFFFFFF